MCGRGSLKSEEKEEKKALIFSPSLSLLASSSVPRALCVCDYLFPYCWVPSCCSKWPGNVFDTRVGAVLVVGPEVSGRNRRLQPAARRAWVARGRCDIPVAALARAARRRVRRVPNVAGAYVRVLATERLARIDTVQHNVPHVRAHRPAVTGVVAVDADIFKGKEGRICRLADGRGRSGLSSLESRQGCEEGGCQEEGHSSDLHGVF